MENRKEEVKAGDSGDRTVEVGWNEPRQKAQTSTA